MPYVVERKGVGTALFVVTPGPCNLDLSQQRGRDCDRARRVRLRSCGGKLCYKSEKEVLVK